MTTTHHPSAARTSGAPGAPRPGLLVLAAVAVLLAVGCVTLGPTWLVADARRAVVAAVEALAAPWPGTVHRAQIEDAANVLLFVPVGALAAWVLRRSGPLLPLVSGAAVSVLVELAQTLLPGRVPDLVDVATNTAGAAVGVAFATLLSRTGRLTSPRRGGVRRPRRVLRSALVTVPLLVVGTVACSPDGDAVSRTSDGAALTAADGYLADGAGLSPFADVPALTRLDSTLRTAVQDAYRDATADGVDFHVTTAWRSAAYQQALFDAAVQEYGSPAAARVHVLTPEASSHVTGDAVDIGPTDAMYWLSRYGAEYGLCQTYGNEIWHFQLAVEPGGTCPAPAADPTTVPTDG